MFSPTLAWITVSPTLGGAVSLYQRQNWPVRPAIFYHKQSAATLSKTHHPLGENKTFSRGENPPRRTKKAQVWGNAGTICAFGWLRLDVHLAEFNEIILRQKDLISLIFASDPCGRWSRQTKSVRCSGSFGCWGPISSAIDSHFLLSFHLFCMSL